MIAPRSVEGLSPYGGMLPHGFRTLQIRLDRRDENSSVGEVPLLEEATHSVDSLATDVPIEQRVRSRL